MGCSAPASVTCPAHPAVQAAVQGAVHKAGHEGGQAASLEMRHLANPQHALAPPISGPPHQQARIYGTQPAPQKCTLSAGSPYSSKTPKLT